MLNIKKKNNNTGIYMIIKSAGMQINHRLPKVFGLELAGMQWRIMRGNTISFAFAGA